MRNWIWAAVWMLGPALSRADVTDVLNADTHADDKIIPALTATLGSHPMHVDYAPGANISSILAASSDTGASNFAVGTTTPAVNHAVYGVMNSSFCCYSQQLELQAYPTLVAQNSIWAVPLAAQVLAPSVIPQAPPATILSSSSPDSRNGGSGWGIEFGMSTGYLGLDTTEDSWISAAMAGFVAGLMTNHPTWNWFDVKAALRVTAANWATGYDHTAYGYGAVNWAAANTASTLYLQPPTMMVQNNTYYAQITLLPYRQTRRVREVVYSVSAAYVWPVKNEYALSDITASGGTLLYTSNGTDVEPTFPYVPGASGTVTFIAFTTDGSGSYSRVEEFSKMATTLMVGTACVH